MKKKMKSLFLLGLTGMLVACSGEKTYECSFAELRGKANEILNRMNNAKELDVEKLSCRFTNVEKIDGNGETLNGEIDVDLKNYVVRLYSSGTFINGAKEETGFETVYTFYDAKLGIVEAVVDSIGKTYTIKEAKETLEDKAFLEEADCQTTEEYLKMYFNGYALQVGKRAFYNQKYLSLVANSTERMILASLAEEANFEGNTNYYISENKACFNINGKIYAIEDTREGEEGEGTVQINVEYERMYLTHLNMIESASGSKKDDFGVAVPVNAYMSMEVETKFDTDVKAPDLNEYFYIQPMN